MAIPNNTVADLISRLGVYRGTLITKLREAQDKLSDLNDGANTRSLSNSIKMRLESSEATLSTEGMTSALSICSLKELRELILTYKVSVEKKIGCSEQGYTIKYFDLNTKKELEEDINDLTLWHAGRSDSSGLDEEKKKLIHSFMAYFIYSKETRQQIQKMVRNAQRLLKVNEVLDYEVLVSDDSLSEEQSTKDNTTEDNFTNSSDCSQQILSAERKKSFSDLATFLSTKPTLAQSFWAMLPFCSCWQKIQTPHLAISAEINALTSQSAGL